MVSITDVKMKNKYIKAFAEGKKLGGGTGWGPTLKAEKNKFPKFSIKTTCADVSRFTRKKSEANEFIEVFVYDGRKYGFWFIMYNGLIFSKRGVFYVLTIFLFFIKAVSIKFEEKKYWKLNFPLRATLKSHQHWNFF